MAVLTTPGYDLQPSASQTPLSTNYISNFDFLNQYLPDTMEQEFARYGNRTISGFLRKVGAELPSNSDLIKWTEEGRLHTKYIDCTSGAAAAANTATITVNDTLSPANQAAGQASQIAIRVGQTVMISDNAGAGSNKAVVTAVNTAASPNTFDVAYYEAAGQVGAAALTRTVFIYGSEFKKGTNGMQGSIEADTNFFENTPIILKDKYSVSGSDMAQIGWVEVTTDAGKGFLWYLKSEHDTRKRFDDYLETSMIEAVPAESIARGNASNSGASQAAGDVGNKGSEGVFYSVNNRGNVWAAGNPTTLVQFDTVVARLDKQGAIEENVLFVNREFSFDIDDMLATLNGYISGGSANSASFGLFDNDTEMALNLGFTGFRRGYDFYKTDWKYLNDPTMRGGLSAVTGSGGVNGLLVPAGTTSVYDQVMGSNAKRPFLHIRYRASETEDRKYKSWITGSAGGAQTSDLDAMEINFLSERAICTLGANNFFIFNA